MKRTISNRLKLLRHRYVIGLLLMLIIAFKPQVSFCAKSTSQEPLEILLANVDRQSLMSDSANFYLLELVQLANKSNDHAYAAEAYYLLGKRCFLLMEDSMAIEYFQKAKVLFSKEENWEKTGFSNFQLGLVHLQGHRLDSALFAFQLAIKIYQQHQLEKNLWAPYMGISSLYKVEENVSAAFKYARKSAEALQFSEDDTSKKIALNHLLNLAREHDSIELYAVYSPMLLKMYSPLEMDDRIVQHINHFVNIEDPKARVEALRKAISRLSDWPPTLELVSSYFYLGKTLQDMGDSRSAISAFESGYSIERDSLGIVQFTPVLLKSLSKLHEQQKDYATALGYYTTYVAIRDSLQQVYMNAKSEELQLQFETKAKDAALAQQLTVLQRRTFQRNMIIVLAVLFLAAGLVFYYHQRRYLRDQATIAIQKEVLHQKELDDLRKQHEIATMQTLITTQEEERKRIALDLHDSLGSLLASLKIQSRKFDAPLDHEALKLISQEHVQLIDTISAEARRIAHNMMPPALIRMGLSAALDDLAQAIDLDRNLEVSFQNIDYDEALNQESEIALYRIVQELCSNVIHHADARHLLIQLSRHNGSASIVVEDDGKGFLPGEKINQGIGIESIKSRVAYMSGEVEFWSVPGEGTSVTIHIPVV